MTSQVIVDIERGHDVFGRSGALLVSALTGLALRGMAAVDALEPSTATAPAAATA